MKLLLDANISWRLSLKLKSYFEDCIHVDYTNLLQPARDIEIWNYAKTNDFVIVTNDSDFINFVILHGFPPKIILFRTGNQSNSYLENLIVNNKQAFEDFFVSSENGVLEIS
jgi:predicted nuclease of predicted toxin-antitoxin system